MAIINLLPDSAKHTKVFKKAGIKIPLKVPKTLLIISPFFILALLIMLLVLVFQVKSKEKAIVLLDKELASIKSNYKEIEALNKRKQELSERLTFYQGIFENDPRWPEKLSSINTIIPSQVWLTNIYTESKPNRILVIKGSATSTVESEIVDSISRFADRLKKEASFSKDFEEIKLGSLVSEKKGNLSLMNFSLVCKFKR